VTTERGSATIKDVAAAAGVGIATVSRVFSGTGAVSERTRERVLAAARELDYRPSALGRGLRLRRSGGIGLVVPDVTDPFCAGLIDGVLACARSLGEHLVLDAAHGDPAREAEIVDRLVEQRLAGVIALPAASGSGAGWRAAVRSGARVVFADRALPGLHEIPAVLADDRSGVRTLVEYLVGLGHRRIAFLGAAAPGAAAGVRERAFRDTLAELGVRGPPATPPTPPRPACCSGAPTSPPCWPPGTCSARRRCWWPASWTCGSPPTCRSRWWTTCRGRSCATRR